MALQQGERYRCQHEGCGCEIEVVQGPRTEEGGGDENPTCCCGETMEKVG